MSQTPRCPKRDCKNKTIIDNQYGILPCKSCQAKDAITASSIKPMPRYITISERDRIQTQQDKHAKDGLQPFIGNEPNPEFVRAYPEYKNDYFTPEQLKKI